MAMSEARAAGVAVDEKLMRLMARGISAEMGTEIARMLQGLPIGGTADTAAAYLLGLSASYSPVDLTTDTLVNYLASRFTGIFDAGQSGSYSPS